MTVSVHIIVDSGCLQYIYNIHISIYIRRIQRPKRRRNRKYNTVKIDKQNTASLQDIKHGKGSLCVNPVFRIPTE